MIEIKEENVLKLVCCFQTNMAFLQLLLEISYCVTDYDRNQGHNLFLIFQYLAMLIKVLVDDWNVN